MFASRRENNFVFDLHKKIIFVLFVPFFEMYSIVPFSKSYERILYIFKQF